MYTPQQLTEIGFTKAVFGGYDMDSVHDVLDPLTVDYTTLYKENAVLKSKLRILVEKLEEYRQQGYGTAGAAEAAKAQDHAQELIRAAEDKAAQIIRDAHARAEQITSSANAAAAAASTASAAAAVSANLSSQLVFEQQRLEKARQTGESFIQSIEADIHRHLALLDSLKALTAAETPVPAPVAPAVAPVPPVVPAPVVPAPVVAAPVATAPVIPAPVAPAPTAPAPVPPIFQPRTPEAAPHPFASRVQEPSQPPFATQMPILPRSVPADPAPADSDDIAKEIEQNLEKLVGAVPNSTFDATPKDTRVMPPLHPESITAKFGDLQFGKNYNPK